MDIDLDHAGIGRDLQQAEARVRGRRVTLQDHGLLQSGRDRLDLGDQFDKVFEPRERRQKDMEPARAGLDTKRGMDDLPIGALPWPAVFLGRLAERGAGGKGIEFRLIIDLLRQAPGQRVQGQAHPQRRIAGQQQQMPAFERPAAALPVTAASGGLIFQRQGIARDPVEAPLEYVPQALPLQRVGQFIIGRVQVFRQAPLAPQIIQRVFISGHDPAFRNTQRLGQRLDPDLGLGGPVAIIPALIGEPFAVLPERLLVLAPVERQGPARQRLAGIPFALAEVRDAAWGEFILQTPQ